PQNFVEMVALPRDAGGSVAFGELRDPFAAVDDYVAPRTATEEAVAVIWAELLGLERVGVYDNFLDVGGHSLVGIRVLLRIQQATGVRLEANALTLQTLEQLAADVDRAGGTTSGAAASESDAAPEATEDLPPDSTMHSPETTVRRASSFLSRLKRAVSDL
ncbi:MAG: phosphopantetheine-binding protein, partial [Longimicrobiales bacterium]